MDAIPSNTELLARIEAYRLRHLMEETTFGRLVANDPRLVKDIRDGRKLRLRTIDRIERALEKAPDEIVADSAGDAEAAE